MKRLLMIYSFRFYILVALFSVNVLNGSGEPIESAAVSIKAFNKADVLAAKQTADTHLEAEPIHMQNSAQERLQERLFKLIPEGVKSLPEEIKKDTCKYSPTRSIMSNYTKQDSKISEAIINLIEKQVAKKTPVEAERISKSLIAQFDAVPHIICDLNIHGK